MNRILAFALLFLSLLAVPPCFCAEDFAAVEDQFRRLPEEARRLMGPLFWLHGDESEAVLRRYVQKCAEGGNGCFTAESRPHKDWLGEGWYRDLAICLDEAKKQGLQMWIFDEAWWPSGEAGGRVPAEHASKKMLLEQVAAKGPVRLEVEEEQLIAVLAGQMVKGKLDGASLVDLTGMVHDGSLAWDAPEGRWKVLVFTWGLGPKRGNNYLVDGASQASVDWYIDFVYQAHYDRFAEDFGNAIRGFFYDEPETYGDWGTEVIPMLKEMGVDWKQCLVAWKSTLADAEAQIAARYAYHYALAEAWGRTLYGGITAWCHDHGVKSIGHFLEHRHCYMQQNLCAGDMIQLQKYSDMGGIDAVFSQFAMGRREAYDHPCWQTPKLGSSITHAYGKPDDISMVEIYGARGQDLSYPEMKWWADHMHVSGINFLIPHSFNPRSPYDTDCPPYFYNNGYEPRWPLYRVLADYTSRLSLVLTGGRHVAPVALLYLGQSASVGRHLKPDKMSEFLQDALYDCDWIPYDVFERDMAIDQAQLRLREEAYRILIVPAAEVIPYPVLEKVQAFYEAGGVVAGYGFLPQQSATLGKSAEDITHLREMIWGTARPGLERCKTNAAGGRSYFLPEEPAPADLQRVFAEDAGIHATLEVLEGDTSNWLHVLHRVKEGRDIFFIANQLHEGEARSFRFRLKAVGTPECWDPLRNEITAIPFERRDAETVECDMILAPLQTALVVFQPEVIDRPAPITAASTPFAEAITVKRGAWTGFDYNQVPSIDADEAAILADCSWVWYPEGDPVSAAPPGTRWFRKRIGLPEKAVIERATMRLTADNAFVLFVNGEEAASGSRWEEAETADLAPYLHAGENVFLIKATNGADTPNPAGLIGRYSIAFTSDAPIEGCIDKTWEATKDDLSAGDADAAKWAPAQECVRMGAGPWGAPGRAKLTLSPVKGDPYEGAFTLPAAWLADDRRIFLEAEGIAPEGAAAIHLNGAYAGGFIGQPYRLEITKAVKAGENSITIAPFAPQKVKIVAY